MTKSNDSLPSLARQWAEDASAQCERAEKAFNECPRWRPFKRERLRDDRTYWRLSALNSERLYMDTLSLSERIERLNDMFAGYRGGVAQ